MSKREIKQVFGISLVGKITPSRVAGQVLARLKFAVIDGINAGTVDQSMQPRFDKLLKDFSSTNEPEEIIEGYQRRRELLTKRSDKVRLSTTVAIEMALNFCFKAYQADFQGKTGLAWLYASEAVAMSGAAWGLDQASLQLTASARETAKSGGEAKAIKTEHCRVEFLRMVNEHSPAWSKTRADLAEAVLLLKPAIVRYARDHHNSVITASTNLPKKWLEEHWNIPKRPYNKGGTLQN